MMTIGIQGGKGSFSEQAAHEFANNHGLEGAKIVYQISSEHVIAGVENGETKCTRGRGDRKCGSAGKIPLRNY